MIAWLALQAKVTTALIIAPYVTLFAVYLSLLRFPDKKE